MKIVKPVVVLVAVVVLLSFMPTAMATTGDCEEYVNPHGKVIPPAGSSTAPGLNPNSGINPDGFFKLCVNVGQLFDSANFTIVDLGADSAPLGDGKDADKIIGTVPYQYNITNATNDQLYCLNIKYTEANGAKPNDFKPMATFDKGTGQSDAVAYHFKGTGDFGWYVELKSGDTTVRVPESGVFTGCLVPPPPKNIGDLPV